MAQQTPPFALQNASHSAALFRQAVSSLLYQPGPLDGASYVVTQQATPNMSVAVAGGQTWLDGTAVANITGVPFSTQASYFALNDASVTLTIAAANATNPRIDVVYVAVADSAYSGVANNVVLAVVTGTPAASPAVPALPSNAIGLAQVRVNANVTSIVTANITPLAAGTTTAGGVVQGTPVPCTAATRPASGSLRLGAPIFETDTGLLRVWNGTGYTDNAPIVCTSGTHPTGIRTGQIIYETDTGNLLVWNGSSWLTYATTTAKAMAFIYQSTAQTALTASTLTTITLQSETVDVGNGHSGGPGWTVPAGQGGTYLVDGGVAATAVTTANTSLLAALAVGGTVVTAGVGGEVVTSTAAGNTTTAPLGAKLLTLSAGQVVTLQGLCTQASWATSVSSTTGSWLSIVRVA